jgi:rhamnosyltransferase subunit B
MLNCVLLTRGTVGEVHPMIQLATVLKQRGHRVQVVSHATFAKDAEAVGVPLLPLDTALEHAAFLEDGRDLNTPTRVPHFFQKHCISKVRTDYELLFQACSAPNSVLVTRYAASVADLMIAEKLGVPVVRIFTAVAQYTTMPLLVALVSSILAPDIDKVRLQLGFSKIGNWEAWLQIPISQIGFWPKWFAAEVSDAVNAAGFIYGGTTPVLLPTLVPAPKPPDAKPILITAGTGKFVTPDFFDVSCAACELLGRRAIVVCQTPDLLKFSPSEAVTIRQWVPSMMDFMQSVSLVVHHGGTITSAEAMAVGIPQLVLPVGADRPDTAARLRGLGIADFVPQQKWNKSLLAERLRYLLTSKIVEGSCNRLAGMVDGQAADRASALIETAVTSFSSQNTASPKNFGSVRSAQSVVH